MQKPPQSHAPPAVALICNSLPPYRIHVQKRIAREMPKIQMWTVCTHDPGDGQWTEDLPEEIRPVLFGQGHPVSRQKRLRYVPSEWRKGGCVIDWIKRQQIRAIILMGYNDLGRVRIIHWCKRNAIPCFLWGDSNIRCDFTTGFKAKVKKYVVSQIISWCAGVFPCGQLGAAYFQKYGADPEKVFYFPNEPEYDLIEKLTQSMLEKTQSDYRLHPDRRRLVYSGRLCETKRPDLLIDAFVTIADQRPQWDLVIVGDGVLRSSLEKRIPPPIRERITWTGFIKDQTIISAIYRACDILVLPSDYEPWALVINEATAAGLAIVTSSIVGASEELVRDGVNGRIFQSGNLDALIACLLDTTSSDQTDAMKSMSLNVLAQWRHRADPVVGLSKALQFVNVITAHDMSTDLEHTSSN